MVKTRQDPGGQRGWKRSDNTLARTYSGALYNRWFFVELFGGEDDTKESVDSTMISEYLLMQQL